MTALCLGTDDLGGGGLRPPWKKEIDLKPGERSICCNSENATVSSKRW